MGNDFMFTFFMFMAMNKQDRPIPPAAVLSSMDVVPAPMRFLVQANTIQNLERQSMGGDPALQAKLSACEAECDELKKKVEACEAECDDLKTRLLTSVGVDPKVKEQLAKLVTDHGLSASELRNKYPALSALLPESSGKRGS